MKRILKYIFTAIFISIFWIVVVFIGTLKGWWYEPFTKNNDPELFTVAVKEKTEKEFVGNFAMAVIKGGQVEKELFNSKNKNVDKNTIFQVSSLSKFVSTVGVMKQGFLIKTGKR